MGEGSGGGLGGQVCCYEMRLIALSFWISCLFGHILPTILYLQEHPSEILGAIILRIKISNLQFRSIHLVG